MLSMETFSLGFEEDDLLRSTFMRAITLQQAERSTNPDADHPSRSPVVPKTLIRYWNDPDDLPDDVGTCLASWDRLAEAGFELRTFSDASAAAYIALRYDARTRDAFARCQHPAMRSDYLRLCFLFAEGGFYVDADDVLLGDGWKTIFRNGALKLQPLCYDIPAGRMIPAAEIWRRELPTEARIFYVNNDPIAAPAGHPVLRRALTRATRKLLGNDPRPEIQATTGPGNLTAALVAHARDLMLAGAPFDFELLEDWEAIAETRWDLSYRSDHRNWRNMDAPES